MSERTISQDWLAMMAARTPGGEVYALADGLLYGVVAPKDPATLVLGAGHLVVVPMVKRATSLAVGWKNWEKLYKLAKAPATPIPLELVSNVETGLARFGPSKALKIVVAGPRINIRFATVFQDHGEELVSRLRAMIAAHYLAG